MDDHKARTLDTTIKVVGVVLAVAGFWDGVRRYNEGRRADAQESLQRSQQAAAAAVRDSRKPFLEKQLSLYFEATQAASRLATRPKGPEWDTARQRFRELFWGELGLVEDGMVLKAMVAFDSALTRFEQRGTPDQAELRQYSLALAHACRSSLQREWGGIDSLPARKP